MYFLANWHTEWDYADPQRVLPWDHVSSIVAEAQCTTRGVLIYADGQYPADDISRDGFAEFTDKMNTVGPGELHMLARKMLYHWAHQFFPPCPAGSH